MTLRLLVDLIRTPFHTQRFAQALKRYLEHPLNSIEDQVPQRGTLLMLAARAGKKNIVNILLNKGAQINDNVLLCASTIEVLECLWVKLDKGPEDQKIRLLNNFFLSNVCRNNEFVIKWVLTKKGIDINYKNCDEQTALMLAASKNSLMLVQLLLDNNASIHERDINNNTALIYAVSHFPNYFGMIEFLISKGASIHDENSFGDTPVTIAARQGLIKTLSLLLHSSNISSNDKNIVKALQGALNNRYFKSAGVLIDFGAPLTFYPDLLRGKLRTKIILKIKESLRMLPFGWGSLEREHHNTHMENYAKASAEAVYHTALPDVLSGLVNEYLFRDNPLLFAYKQRWHELSLSPSPVPEKAAVASNEDKKHKREDKEMVLRSSKRYCQRMK